MQTMHGLGGYRQSISEMDLYFDQKSVASRVLEILSVTFPQCFSKFKYALIFAPLKASCEKRPKSKSLEMHSFYALGLSSLDFSSFSLTHRLCGKNWNPPSPLSQDEADKHAVTRRHECQPGQINFRWVVSVCRALKEAA